MRPTENEAKEIFCGPHIVVINEHRAPLVHLSSHSLHYWEPQETQTGSFQPAFFKKHTFKLS